MMGDLIGDPDAPKDSSSLLAYLTIGGLPTQGAPLPRSSCTGRVGRPNRSLPFLHLPFPFALSFQSIVVSRPSMPPGW